MGELKVARKKFAVLVIFDTHEDVPTIISAMEDLKGQPVFGSRILEIKAVPV